MNGTLTTPTDPTPDSEVVDERETFALLTSSDALLTYELATPTPSPVVQRVWHKAAVQVRAAVVLAGRYGNASQRARTLHLAKLAVAARKELTADPRNECAHRLASVSGQLRSLIVGLHATAGHHDSIPAGQRPAPETDGS